MRNLILSAVFLVYYNQYVPIAPDSQKVVCHSCMRILYNQTDLDVFLGRAKPAAGSKVRFMGLNVFNVEVHKQ